MYLISKRIFHQNLILPRLRIIRQFCSNKSEDVDLSKVRTIGVLAHIDAGKTTTTERMLYYAGKIKNMGEVHHGNTVTDYMAQERERGITIRSAAVTFNWKNYQFNLIDTPGHIDFTMEVEETLSVLDGVVVVLDGSAGVEAQTLTVWRQADRYKIPRIVFVNKMDRHDASLTLSCQSIESKLDKPTISLQIPLFEHNKLAGIIDVLTLEKVTSAKNSILKTQLSEAVDPELWNRAKSARGDVINKLADIHDQFATKVIEAKTVDDITTVDIQEALRNVTIKQTAVPVLCGTAYKNVGIQSLMDSVILYLPSPDERNTHFNVFKNNLCARVFKIIHDRQRGPLVFFRIYSGNFKKGQKIYNITQNYSEATGRLYIAYADEFQEVENLNKGNIAVVSSLRETIVGDLVSNTATAAESCRKEMLKLLSKDKSINGEEFVQKIFATGARIPEPVFFCSIEPPSLASQAALEQALIELQREDPSLRVTHDTETGQTVLAGMGELHLDIIKDRILKEYKIDADLGPLQVAYREAPIAKVSDVFVNETQVGNSKQSVLVALSLYPATNEDPANVMKLDKTAEAASNLANMVPRHLLAVKQGIDVGISHGPKIYSQVSNLHVMIHKLEVGKGTSESMITATVTQGVQKLLKQSGTCVLEPIMSLEIVAPDDYMSSIINDLSRRRSSILNVAMRGKQKVVHCETPLADLMGYSTVIRTISSGTATFTMEFLQYKLMTASDENKAIQSIRGF